MTTGNTMSDNFEAAVANLQAVLDQRNGRTNNGCILVHERTVEMALAALLARSAPESAEEFVPKAHPCSDDHYSKRATHKDAVGYWCDEHDCRANPPAPQSPAKDEAGEVVAEDEDGLPAGYARWYNAYFRERPADTSRDADCEASWRAAFQQRAQPTGAAEVERSGPFHISISGDHAKVFPQAGIGDVVAFADWLDARLNDEPQQAQGEPFQFRVQPWLIECFGAEIARDKIERNHRFLEESLELVQALGCTQDEAHKLVDYVFGRPAGAPRQEVGGVMVTLAALCLASDLDMHACGDDELARVWTKVEQIREKQKRKPALSPLPGVYPERLIPADQSGSAQPVATIHSDGYWTHEPGKDPFDRFGPNRNSVRLTVYARPAVDQADGRVSVSRELLRHALPAMMAEANRREPDNPWHAYCSEIASALSPNQALPTQAMKEENDG